MMPRARFIVLVPVGLVPFVVGVVDPLGYLIGTAYNLVIVAVALADHAVTPPPRS